MGRTTVAVASGLFLVLLAWPAVAPGELDSLPLSNYPMFAHDRDRVTSFGAALHVDADGAEHPLDLRVVGGTDQPVQAAMTVSAAIRTGATAELCGEIARGVDEPGTVEVVTLWYDAPGWYAGSRQPVDKRVHASCPASGARP